MKLSPTRQVCLAAVAALFVMAGGCPEPGNDTDLNALVSQIVDEQLANRQTAGPPGTQGEMGLRGEMGLQGEMGSLGVMGLQGEMGSSGGMGLQGDPGASPLVDGTLFANAISSDSPLQLRTAGKTRIHVDNTSGNVGIGTTTPSSALQVIGDVAVDGALQVIGDISVDGAVVSGPGAVRSALAYGAVRSNGTLYTGSSNLAKVEYVAVASRYEITIADENFHFANYVVSVTPAATSPRMATVDSLGGRLLVYFFDNDGAAEQSSFHFVVYKP